MPSTIDFIGDVHGRARDLERLLQKLGYRHAQGAWRCSSRMAIFVGDLVDRGPEQFRTVDIVRRMRDAGSALCVMGNHEHSAIGWVTPDPNKPGEFCRPHKSYNQKIHEAFLLEGQAQPQLYRELVDWMRTLPVLLEIQGVRVAHACWDERHTPLVKAAQTQDGALSSDALLDSLTQGTPLHTACEVVMKGPEAHLRDEHAYVDHLGKRRQEVRIAWWDPRRRLRDVALPMPGLNVEALPDVVLPEEQYPKLSRSHLHIVGHYWMRGAPTPLLPNAISVDYSGDPYLPMTAYCWQGEQVFQAEHFVQVI
jgi:hypothetical protein